VTTSEYRLPSLDHNGYMPAVPHNLCPHSSKGQVNFQISK
jgi:hypothetical protein